MRVLVGVAEPAGDVPPAEPGLDGPPEQEEPPVPVGDEDPGAGLGVAPSARSRRPGQVTGGRPPSFTPQAEQNGKPAHGLPAGWPSSTSRTKPRTSSRWGRKGQVPDPGHRLADVGVEIGEPLEGERGPHPDLGLELGLDLVVGQVEGAAAGVVDDHHRPGPQEALGEQERPEDVVGDDAAGVAQDVGVARLQPEHAGRVDAGVHAGQDGDAELRRARAREGWPGVRAARRSSFTMSMDGEG